MLRPQTGYLPPPLFCFKSHATTESMLVWYLPETGTTTHGCLGEQDGRMEGWDTEGGQARVN